MELIANSPVPGVREQLTTLSEALSEAGLTLKLAAKLPAALEGPGQCRLVIDNETLPMGLLGMSFLGHFDMQRQGSTLVLRRRR